ncbi:MAG: family 43 glycosylhydrolase, partial [Paludibacteraceae bacterium]
KDSVSASDSYTNTIPSYYEGATGYYTISQKADELIPSDFDGKTHTVNNPLLWVDVPDPSVVRVDDTYYMVSTTMHMSPGVPVMASKDLVRWRTINYAHGVLTNNDEMNLTNGKNAYGKGSWASSIRYKDGVFYVLTPSYTSNRTHLYKTTDIENGPWTETTLPFYHDPSLLLDDNGRMYVVYGNTDIHIVELKEDGSGVKTGGLNKILIADASSIAGSNFYVKSEGAHIEKINGQYYVFLISWPAGNCRTELVYRCATLDGNYTGKIALQDQGVAQGGIFDTPNGDWYAMLFQDAGSVGRIPYLVPVSWSDGWPVFGVNGKVPASLQMEAAQEDGYGMVSSDDFEEETLIKEWQWNHNPDNRYWSLNATRPGYLRLTNGRTDASLVDAKNTLTQRAFGPVCSAWTVLDTKGMKDGDYAGLCAFQAKYGFVGAKVSGNSKYIVMTNASSDNPQEVKSIALSQDKIWLRIDMNYQNRTDKANFYYSLDGEKWEQIGNTLSMSYTMPHFTGYRYGLFCFGTKNTGGYADFDFFNIGSSFGQAINLHQNKKVTILASSLTITILSKESVGTDTYRSSEMDCSIYPNPTSECINIVGAIGLKKVEIIDINGRCVQTASSSPISVQKLKDGVYILRISDENGTDTKYIEIKR